MFRFTVGKLCYLRSISECYKNQAYALEERRWAEYNAKLYGTPPDITSFNKLLSNTMEKTKCDTNE